MGQQQPGSGGPENVLVALSGLLMAMFVSTISTTIVSNALPTVVADLHGGQSVYTWIVTAALLTSTAAMPVFGKLVNQFDKKRLLNVSIAAFIAASVACGFAQSAPWLIAFRALQGVGLGGVQAMTKVCIAAMIPARERGRYNGYTGAVMASATLAGPLVGGAIVDSGLGWRWVFFVNVPLGVLALLVLDRTLHLLEVKRHAAVDFAGASLITSGVCLLLIWVTLAGHSFAWQSWPSAALLGSATALISGTWYVERRAAEPIIPLTMLRMRTPLLAILVSACIGIGFFSAPVFLSQYFQIARGYSATTAGLLTLPLMLGLVMSATVFGRIIAVTGRWKRYLVAGCFTLVLGFTVLSRLNHVTSVTELVAATWIVGIGFGMTLQNLVLAAQNSVGYGELGVSTSLVNFFRALGGTIGVAVLGALLNAQMIARVRTGLTSVGLDRNEVGPESMLNVNSLPPNIATLVRAAFGDATATLFQVCALLSVLGLLLCLCFREEPLRRGWGHG